jgi:hypothetical protein
MELSSRAIVAIIAFIFGTTFLWLTPAFVGSGVKAEGTLWTVFQILSLLN